MFINSLEENFQEADFVFLAKVTQINDQKVRGFSDSAHYMMDSSYVVRGGYHPTFQILKKYKGKLKKGREVNLHSQWGNCDFFFEKNKEYVVFGYYDQEGRIATNVCWPIILVKDESQLIPINKLK